MFKRSKQQVQLALSVFEPLLYSFYNYHGNIVIKTVCYPPPATNFFREKAIQQFFLSTVYIRTNVSNIMYKIHGKTGRAGSVISKTWSGLSFSVLKIIVHSVSNK